VLGTEFRRSAVGVLNAQRRKMEPLDILGENGEPFQRKVAAIVLLNAMV
jgi:hypothetical protein